ncbi:hypothetical protein [Pseudogulbenkiania sp. MAI-1]|uniref:hypothetical protein n=1 Tax=Pseudogulbenkiania sp. MAI-1 TaxID=990370 RepID=UPI00045E61A8|nr:hypothetical protein [Pseudogulbenkiania sp. MAI-1]
MVEFLSIMAVVLLALLIWVIRSRRPQANRILDDSPGYARHTQTRPVDVPSQMTGRDYGILLRAAHGDRSRLETWVVAEQQRATPPLSRDEAIERLAERLRLSRS